MEQEYLAKVTKAIFDGIRENSTVIKTSNGGDFEIVKNIRCIDSKFDSFKLHELLSPNGCKMSGEIVISAHVYLPSVEDPRNISSDRLFRFTFKDASVLFDSEKEEFILLDDLNINHIFLDKSLFGR